MSSKTQSPTDIGILVTGAAGFIGSHLVDRLLAAGHSVIGVDNLCRGTRANLSAAFQHPCFTFVELDLAREDAALQILPGLMRDRNVSRVWHMAANSDIAAGIADPSIDLRDTFLTTHVTLSVMRQAGARELVFASTSAIYGELDKDLAEDTGPLLPISSYGAMKLASEASISAAVGGSLARAWIFRFPNVVGSRGTHGVIYDLLHKLRRSTHELEVLGDGRQCKPYMHVADLLDGMELLVAKADDTMNVFNLSPDGIGTSVSSIAEAVVAAAAPGARIRYTGGDRGWRGDVPRFRYVTARAKSKGWSPRYLSDEAIDRAVRELHAEIFRIADA